MSKKKFSLSSDFVKVSPEEPVETKININEIQAPQKIKKDSLFTGPNTNRVHFSSSLDANLKNEFKIWVTQKGSNISTELENAIKLIMKK